MACIFLMHMLLGLFLGCPQDAAYACIYQSCALCCDRRWLTEYKATSEASNCVRHQPNGVIQTLGQFLFDGFMAVVHCGVAWLQSFLNCATALALVSLTAGSNVDGEGILWLDGGSPSGTPITEWCFQVIDDKKEIWNASVSDLTRCGFHRLLVLKGKCEAKNLRNAVLPTCVPWHALVPPHTSMQMLWQHSRHA